MDLKFKKLLLGSAIFFVSVFFLITFSKKDTESAKIKETKSGNIEVSVENSNFIDWWNYKYQSLPSNVEGEYVQGKYADQYKPKPYKFDYISNYDLNTLLKYYDILETAYKTGGIGHLRGHEYDDLAEQTNMHKKFYMELGNYMAFYYFDYLDTITKEWFSNHKEIGIEPYYYSSIKNAAGIGNLIFDCDIVINRPKDASDFEDEIEKRIQYLKNNLPDMIKVVRILDIKYVNEVAGTSGFLHCGYIWKKEGDILEKKDKSGHGSKSWAN